MTNPKTIDGRDVAHPTNPIGGQTHVEEIDNPNLAQPLETDAARFPAGGNAGSVAGMPQDVRNDLPDTGLGGGVPPARSGRSGRDAVAPAARGGNAQRVDQPDMPHQDAARMKSPRSND